ncbi:MAG: transporter substrate-binding protein [Acidimicrobiaceae bacterium]|nr:transporter substrate-binding protein [Acidimicrobiaceae bacterium]
MSTRSPIHRRWVALGAIPAAVALTAGLSSAASTGQGSGLRHRAVAMTTVTFMGDYTPAWPAQVPWNVAMSKGWFKDAGLNIVYNLPPTNAAPAQLVGVGKEDVTVSYTPDTLTAASKGLDVKALAAIWDRNVEGIETFDPGVKTPQQLSGKKVAIYDFPMAQLNWKTFSTHYGIKNVQMVSEGNYGVPILLAGKANAIDGAAGGELTDSQIRQHKKATFFVYNQANGIPNFYWFIIDANGSWLKKHSAAAKKFVAVMECATKWSAANPAQAAAIYYKTNLAAGSEQLALQGWKDIVGLETKPFVANKPTGYMDPSIWTSYLHFLTKAKFLTSSVNLSNVLTNNQYVPSSLPSNCASI